MFKTVVLLHIFMETVIISPHVIIHTHTHTHTPIPLLHLTHQCCSHPSTPGWTLSLSNTQVCSLTPSLSLSPASNYIQCSVNGVSVCIESANSSLWERPSTCLPGAKNYKAMPRSSSAPFPTAD